jgi:hypothetical protein
MVCEGKGAEGGEEGLISWVFQFTFGWCCVLGCVLECHLG